MAKYFGLYKSALIQRSGCVHQLLTSEQEDLGFIPSVWHTCSMCGENHTFSYLRCFTISSESQKKNLYSWARLNHIEIDLDLNKQS